ncbi:MAG: hypothetical protein ACOCVA_00495 [Prolixibacteraceae bacterium]
MALFTKKQFEELASEKEKYCISIYIPTERNGENRESVIYLKNRITAVEKELENFGLKQREIHEYTTPIKKLHDDVNLWRHLSDALVIFRNKERFEYHTLPLEVEEFSLVSDRYYLLPLINLFNEDNLFFILLLSLKKNRLYEATQHEITELATEDYFPEDIYDSVGHDVEQKSLQMRGEQAGDGRANYPGKTKAMYHGKGEGKDDKEIEILKYMEDVDDGISKLFEGYRTPLLIAAGDNIFSHFKDISNYKYIYPKNVSGNYDDEDIVGIHEKAMDILTPYFDEVRNSKKESYSEAIGKTTASLEDIVVSADAGKIDTLFVAKHTHIWGEYHREAGKIEKHEDKKNMDNCLLDYAARNVFLKGGQVFIEDQEDMPENTAPANAILRY